MLVFLQAKRRRRFDQFSLMDENLVDIHVFKFGKIKVNDVVYLRLINVFLIETDPKLFHQLGKQGLRLAHANFERAVVKRKPIISRVIIVFLSILNRLLDLRDDIAWDDWGDDDGVAQVIAVNIRKVKFFNRFKQNVGIN